MRVSQLEREREELRAHTLSVQSTLSSQCELVNLLENALREKERELQAIVSEREKERECVMREREGVRESIEREEREKVKEENKRYLCDIVRRCKMEIVVYKQEIESLNNMYSQSMVHVCSMESEMSVLREKEGEWRERCENMKREMVSVKEELVNAKQVSEYCDMCV